MGNSMILLILLLAVFFIINSKIRNKNRDKNGNGGVTIIGKDDEFINTESNHTVEGTSNKLSYEGEIVEIPTNLDSSVIMVIEDVFCVTGKGTVVTGKIVNGELRIGDNVIIQDPQTMEGKNSTVVGIEQFRKTIDVANIGEYVGVLVSNVAKSDISAGDRIIK